MEFCLFEGWLCYAMLRRRGGASRRDVYRRRSRAQTPIHTHLCWHLAPHAHARLCGYLRYSSTPRGLPKPRSAYILLPRPKSLRISQLIAHARDYPYPCYLHAALTCAIHQSTWFPFFKQCLYPPARSRKHDGGIDGRKRGDRKHGVVHEDGVKRIHGPRAILSIEQHEVLDRLLSLSQHVDDVLRKLTAEISRHGRNLRMQVAEEGLEKICGERLRGQRQLLVAVERRRGERGKLSLRARRVRSVSLALPLPEGAHASQQRVHLFQLASVALELGREWGRVGENHRSVELALGDQLDVLARGFLLERYIDDGTRRGFSLQLRLA